MPEVYPRSQFSVLSLRRYSVAFFVSSALADPHGDIEAPFGSVLFSDEFKGHEIGIEIFNMSASLADLSLPAVGAT